MLEIVAVPVSLVYTPQQYIVRQEELQVAREDLRKQSAAARKRLDALLNDGYELLGSPVRNQGSDCVELVYTLHKPGSETESDDLPGGWWVKLSTLLNDHQLAVLEDDEDAHDIESAIMSHLLYYSGAIAKRADKEIPF